MLDGKEGTEIFAKLQIDSTDRFAAFKFTMFNKPHGFPTNKDPGSSVFPVVTGRRNASEKFHLPSVSRMCQDASAAWDFDGESLL